MRLVPAAVRHAGHRLDAEIAVLHRVVAGQRRGGAVDVDAVVLRARRMVAYE
jgi:hypothetical protein